MVARHSLRPLGIFAAVGCLLAVVTFYVGTQGKAQTGLLSNPRPAVARHPTSPISIEAFQNLDLAQPFAWQALRIQVRNVSPLPIAKAEVHLGFLLTPDSMRSVVYASEKPFQPGETATLVCTMPPNLAGRFEDARANAIWSYFDTGTVEFNGMYWLNGQYWTPTGKVSSDGQAQHRIDPDANRRMLEKMGVPSDWERSWVSDQYERTISGPSPDGKTGGAANCFYFPDEQDYSKRCAGCPGSVRVQGYRTCVSPDPYRGCFRLRSAEVPCGTCIAYSLKYPRCNSPFND